MQAAKMTAIVGYRRVSTTEQGKSGLGLEAQQVTIDGFASSNSSRVLATYTEVESGRNSERPKLKAALAHARRSGAVLVVAKLDRLARNVAFLSALMDSGVEFVCCDNPHANRLTIHILAAVAEDEARRISDRTKEALAQYKARGGLLGASRPECRKLSDEARRRGHAAAGKTLRQQADSAYVDLLPMIRERRTSGATLQQIADELTAAGHTTRRGKRWSHVQVRAVILRDKRNTVGADAIS